MNITIELPKTLEHQIIEAAKRHGKELEVFITSIIQQYLVFRKVDEELEKADLKTKGTEKGEIAKAVKESQEFHTKMLFKLREKDDSISADVSYEEKGMVQICSILGNSFI